MKNKIKKLTALILTLMMVMTLTMVPAHAGDQVQTYTSHFGVTYTVNYNIGSVDVDGTHIYLGYNATSPRVQACGWKTAVGLKSAEIADLISLDPAWWGWVKTQYPTTEQYYAWKSQQ